MESLSRHGRGFSSVQGMVKQRRSGYEPSDTETERQESPRRDMSGGARVAAAAGTRNVSPFKMSWRTVSSRFEFDKPSPAMADGVSPVKRRHSSKSPFKGRRDGNIDVTSVTSTDVPRNISPVDGRARHVSPYKDRPRRNMSLMESRAMHVSPYNEEEFRNISPMEGRAKHVAPYKEGEGRKLKEGFDGIGGSSRRPNHRPVEIPNYSRRASSNPRTKTVDLNGFDHEEKKSGRTPSPLSRNQSKKEKDPPQIHAPSVGEINEMIAQAKLREGVVCPDPQYETTDSIGDLFFYHDRTAQSRQKDVLKPKIVNERIAKSNQRAKVYGGYEINHHRGPSGSALSRSTSRQSSGRISSTSSRMSDISEMTTDSTRNFTASRRKAHSETWFGCMKKESCRKSAKSPEQNRAFDEVSFIRKAFVVEEMRQFWADKYQPASLNGFTCHRKEALLLKELVSQNVCPHLLLKGPAGSGKRSLVMALLREIFGDASWNISHEIRYFHIQDKRPIKVAVPLTSSAHHVELNVSSDVNARYAFMALVKEINNIHAVTPEISIANLKADYKVIVLYDVDKAPETIQHLIKWVIDCYSDACKLFLCCGDDINVPERVKNHCKVVSVDASETNEVVEVLMQIASNEDLTLPMSFAARIANKSKQNLRKAIMALEACKANNYPFLDDQPIPIGWEEVVAEVAADTLADPSPKRLFIIRGKFQKLLTDFVHPKLILQKLVEEFLKRVDSSVKREIYYWHTYYDKRLPSGTSALLKLEEFVAKFMSIYRKSFTSHHI